VRRISLVVLCMGCGGVATQPDGGTDGASDAPNDAAHEDAGAFATGVVSFEAGACSGFGASDMPQIVLGAPVGGGTSQGSTDVVSLGAGGSIVLSFAPNAIVDGPGPDFVVFENAFFVSGNPNNVYAEPGEVSVSDDGVVWSTYPCTATAGNPPYGQCAGTHPVFSPPYAPTDYPNCGGDAFDLADLGVTHARYVRIVDHSGETCTPPQNNTGFDLDAIVILHPGP